MHGYEEVLEQMGLDQPQEATPQGPPVQPAAAKVASGVQNCRFELGSLLRADGFIWDFPALYIITLV